LEKVAIGSIQPLADLFFVAWEMEGKRGFWLHRTYIRMNNKPGLVLYRNPVYVPSLNPTIAKPPVADLCHIHPTPHKGTS
jgi:hypothetical protein